MRSHNEFTDDDFFIVTGYETSIRSDDVTFHCFHEVVDMNFFAKDSENTTHIGFHPE